MLDKGLAIEERFSRRGYEIFTSCTFDVEINKKKKQMKKFVTITPKISITIEEKWRKLEAREL